MTLTPTKRSLQSLHCEKMLADVANLAAESIKIPYNGSKEAANPCAAAALLEGIPSGDEAYHCDRFMTLS